MFYVRSSRRVPTGKLMWIGALWLAIAVALLTAIVFGGGLFIWADRHQGSAANNPTDAQAEIVAPKSRATAD